MTADAKRDAMLAEIVDLHKFNEVLSKRMLAMCTRVAEVAQETKKQPENKTLLEEAHIRHKAGKDMIAVQRAHEAAYAHLIGFLTKQYVDAGGSLGIIAARVGMNPAKAQKFIEEGLFWIGLHNNLSKTSEPDEHDEEPDLEAVS